MAAIHFVSLFGADLDYDIVDHWRNHYLTYGYDTYTVFLHSTEPLTEHFHYISSVFKECGFTVRVAPNVKYTTGMRNDILTEFSQSLDPNDYMVVADSDEFHTCGSWNVPIRDLIHSCDVLHGVLVDRWGCNLCAATNDSPLDNQYPYSGDLYQHILNWSIDPWKHRWRVPNRNKIIAAKAGLPVAHLGSHVLYNHPAGLKMRNGCDVLHYKWRKTICDRLKTKWYYCTSFESAVLEYFNQKVAV